MNLTQAKQVGGPWPCRVCGAASTQCYRCDSCGADFVDRRDA